MLKMGKKHDKSVLILLKWVLQLVLRCCVAVA